MHVLGKCVRARLAPVNKLKRLVAPNGPSLILSLPRCSHPAPPYYIKYFPKPVLEASCLQIRPRCQGSSRLGWIYTEPNRVGRVIKDRVSQDVIFEGRIVMVKLFRSEVSRTELSWAKYSRVLTQSRIVEGLLVKPSFSNTKY